MAAFRASRSSTSALNRRRFSGALSSSF
uniref:Uncharacterized protein n=1 Tax=Arundo donax TaxID=35708 RepID=A0A0A8Y698_ARUDO